MRLEQLYYLTEVAKTGSITVTAERIYVSQPSITDAIKKLEQELGVALLHRSHRGVSLTEAGEKVVQISQQILGMVDKLNSEVEIYKDTKTPQITGNLSIYVSPDVSVVILSRVLDVFGKHYPNVKTIVKERDIFHLLEEVYQSGFDLGIITILENTEQFDEIFREKDLHFERLFIGNIYAVVSNSSPLASRKSISMKELLKYPLTFYNTNTDNCWIDYFKEYGEPNIYLKSSSIEVWINAISKNLAIGFVVDFYYDYVVKNKGLVPVYIKEDLKAVVGWIRPNNKFSPAAQEFVKVLKSQC